MKKYLQSATLTIALTTLRGFTRDRIFYAVLLVALLLIAFSYSLAGLTFIGSYKILMDFGFTAISLCGILISIFVGIISVSKEIENKTIYTILAKPVHRSQYILGKYLGCGLVVLIAHLIMSLSLLTVIWIIGIKTSTGLYPCFYLMTLESLLILSIALFSSIFSSSVLATCLTLLLFLIGRSAYFFHSASEKAEGLMRYVFRILYDILPNLERFNLREMAAYSKPYPDTLLLDSTIYALAYTTLFLTLSTILFIRRDMP